MQPEERDPAYLWDMWGKVQAVMGWGRLAHVDLAKQHSQLAKGGSISASRTGEQELLYSEPYLSLMEELRELRNDFSILRAIAQESIRLNEITQSARVGSATITSRYLDMPMDLKIKLSMTPGPLNRIPSSPCFSR